MPTCGTYDAHHTEPSPGRRRAARRNLAAHASWLPPDDLPRVGRRDPRPAHGSWPDRVTAFDLGRALRRAAGNIDNLQEEHPEADANVVRQAALEEFTRGWRAADSVHGPVDRRDIALPTAEEYENGQTWRVLDSRTGRLWWATSEDTWTDGATIVDASAIDDMIRDNFADIKIFDAPRAD